MSGYVKTGYVKTGYVDGGGFAAPDAGQHPMKFFVSNGTKSIGELTSNIASLLDDGDMAVLYVPESSKIMLGSKSGFDEFIGGVDINTILTDQAFINKVRELTTVSMNASIVANDGSVVSGAVVRQISDKTFEIDVPDGLVSTGYKLVLSEV